MAETNEELLAKRRREARLAMEGEEARARREAAEHTAKEKAEIAKRLAAAKAEKEATEKAAAEAKLAAEEKRRQDLETAQRARVTQIRTSESAINTLKKTPAASTLSSLRTLKTDLAQATRTDNLSLSKIAAAGGDPLAGAQPKGHALRWLAILALLLLAGGGGLWWWRQNPTTPVVVTPVVPANTPLIFTETHQDLDVAALTGNTLATELNRLADSQDFGQGTIKDLRLISGNQALNFNAARVKLGLKLPTDLNPYWEDRFMLGLFNSGGRNVRFLILTNRFYEKIYAGLLDWEKTGLPETLLPILTSNPGTKTSWDDSFSDSLVRNKDVRILKNQAGETILFYGFLDREHLVFTTSQEAFLEVYKRFIATAQ
jgi:hypothetical protein